MTKNQQSIFDSISHQISFYKTDLDGLLGYSVRLTLDNRFETIGFAHKTYDGWRTYSWETKYSVKTREGVFKSFKTRRQVATYLLELYVISRWH